MSKAKDSKHNQPNVVAKLMGLDALPRRDPNLAVERSHRKYYSQRMYGHIGSPFKYWQLKDSFMDKEMIHEVHPSTEQNAHNKDVYKTLLQSKRISHVRDKAPERGRWGEDVDEEKIALIHQKFMEVKRMSTDERLRQSKQFEDALEVLSSNSDLLIKLLDSQNLYELHSTPLAEKKRITLLKPLKMVDNDKSDGKGKKKKKKKNDGLIKKPGNVDQAAVWENKNLGHSPGNQKVDEFQVQSTRIVVLKPSSGKTHELKAVFSPTTSSPRHLQNVNFYQGPEDDDVLLSRKVAKEISQQVHEILRSHQRDENLYSSAIYNGYSGDECSFNKSYHDFKDGNFSDLEVMSLPRHSWDHINHYGSLYSTLSLGRVTCYPESPLCVEAKRRLYERWIVMESCHQEQMHVRRISTLGEMLSLSHTKKSAPSEVEGINEDQEPSKSVSCRHSFNEEISINYSAKNHSVPASSVCETGLKVGASDYGAGKAHGSKVLTNSKSMRLSFRGKVSSFLFSRNKKSTKEKSKDESQFSVTETSVSLVNSAGVLKDGVSQSFNGTGFEEGCLPALYESLGKNTSDSVSNRQQAIITSEPRLIVPKPEISSENQDQPSPISVLETSFEDDNHESLDCIKSGHGGSLVPLKSNLIDKSPPIGSIARTLSWGNSCGDVSSLDTKLEEQEWLLFVEKLLSAAGLDDQVQNDPFNTRWQSLESPLDPSLRDKYAKLNDKEHQHLDEAKRRKMRSNQKLAFDYVNAAILEVAGYCGSEKYLKKRVLSGGHSMLPVQQGACPLFVDHIVAQMKELMASGVRCVWGDCGDSNSLVVENVVKKEVVGIRWVELMGLEVDILGREIEGELIHELVENAVVDFTGRA